MMEQEPVLKRLKSEDALVPEFYLIENGFDPSNIQQYKRGGIFGNNDALEITPMWWACKHGDLWICQWLYQKNAFSQLRHADSRGLTPLLIACSFGQLEIIQWLFSLGVCEGITQEEHEDQEEDLQNVISPLSVACKYGHTNVAIWLNEVSSIECKSKNHSLLHLACTYGHLGTAQWLLGVVGYDLQQKDSDGKTCMYYASDNSMNFSTTLWLLFQGAVSINGHIDKNLLLRDVCHNSGIHSEHCISFLLSEYCDEKMKLYSLFQIFLFGFISIASDLNKLNIDVITTNYFKTSIAEYLDIKLLKKEFHVIRQTHEILSNVLIAT